METANAALDVINIRKIKPSKTNPRKNFDKTAHEELTESVKKHGVLQPILVRPNGDLFEIVAGERRYRAAVAADLEEIPVNIRDLSDEEMLEVQIVENLQRQDLHPLEEAEGYRQLHEKHSYSADDIAIKVGKSKAYVYARLKLCQLAEPAKKAFWDGGLNPSTALLVARIPDVNLQAKAAKELSGRDGEAMSYREASDHIQENYMLRLSSAQFDIKDSGLYAKAGACVDCPKRTGNQKELFPDIKNADVCTDVHCFKKKTELDWDRKKLEAESKGVQVLSDQQVAKVFPYSYNPDSIADSSGFLNLSERNWRDSKDRTWAQLLKAHKIEIKPTLARGRDGKVRELAKRNEVEKALKAAGYKESKSSSGMSEAERAKLRAENARKKKCKDATEIILGEIVKAVEKKGIVSPVKFWRAFISLVLMHEIGDEQQKKMNIRRGLGDQQDSRSYSWPVEKLPDQLKSENELIALGVECFARCGGLYADSYTDGLKAMASIYNINIKTIENQLTAKKKGNG